jgi:Co/Zn/Cd efflux system component
LCTRNDAPGNIAVLLAAVRVSGAGAAWPDLIVAALLATLAMPSAVHVLRQARTELGKIGPKLKSTPTVPEN